MPTLIYLIGFMGSGKSTLGSIVANVLGYDFVDLDEVLEKRFGMSIQAFFDQDGEDAFRQAEHTLVSETISEERKIVSCGGGAFLQEANRTLMMQHGLTVYLRVSVPLLVSRLRRSSHRPLLFDDEGKTLEGDALTQRVRALLAERAPFYELAHVVVDIEPGSIGRSVDRLVSRLTHQ